MARYTKVRDCTVWQGDNGWSVMAGSFIWCLYIADSIERSINRRHVYTQQTALQERDLSIAGMYIHRNQHQRDLSTSLAVTIHRFYYEIHPNLCEFDGWSVVAGWNTGTEESGMTVENVHVIHVGHWADGYCYPCNAKTHSCSGGPSSAGPGRGYCNGTNPPEGYQGYELQSKRHLASEKEFSRN